MIVTKKQNQESKKNRGFATLVSVMALGAVGSVIAVSMLLLGIGSQKTSSVVEQSSQAKALADTCIEEALQQVRDSTAFTGTGNLSWGFGTCTYTVTSQGGQTRNITASAEVGTIIQKVEVIIESINPNLVITSWQEVPDF